MTNSIEKAILNILSKTERLTPSQIVSQLSYPRRVVMQTINDLVCNEQLLFTNELGTTFVRLSYNKPVIISEHIVLIPPNRTIPKDLLSRVAIKLSRGAAFGDGHHPTTSLALHLLDETLYKNNTIAVKNALDIGTGTGVLAIAAAMLGAKSVFATDIDPIAVYEAQINVKLNQLTDCITLIKSDTYPDHTYQLIMANLRLPSLIHLAANVYKQIDKSGFIICSGYTNEESQCLIRKFEQHNMKCIDHKQLNNWAGGVFTR